MDGSGQGQSASGGGRSASVPVTFDGTVGLFSPASGARRPVAILLASPWGLEEMCGRKFFRIMAEELADNGFASLRFDYAGTGDSFADDSEVSGFDVWTDNLVAAVGQLRQLSGCERIVIVAQGIGAAVAMQANKRIDMCETVAFLAPVVSGRAYLREMQAMARMTDDKLGIAAQEVEGAAITLAGLSLSGPLAADLKLIDLMKVEKLSFRQALVLTRDERPSDVAFATHLHDIGLDVERAPFDGYHSLTTNPTMAEVPHTVIAKLLDWLENLSPTPLTIADAQPSHAVAHGLSGFVEQPLRFGEDNRLYGILCRPTSHVPLRSVAVVFLSAGYDRMAGWGRCTARLARVLAQEGIASLRFDCANVADSPPRHGRDGQVLYDPAQLDDVHAAIDFLEKHLPGCAFLITGRCSGAYLALQSAWRHERVAGVVAVNPVVYEWPAGRSVAEALANPVQSMDHYVENVWRVATFRKLLRGEIKIADKLRQMSVALGRRMLRPFVWLAGGITARERAVSTGFRQLARRKVPVRLLYSAGDVGLEEFGHFFGAEGQRLRSFQGMAHAVIAGADHNFTPAHARQAYLTALTDAAALLEPRDGDMSR
ncbi:pimeloyl-ACP methyl ester carboxylesterase [Neorhizobium huautlense]|uniref:Pimeloyl-ACP methyl ester carboxylesterase n=1 Tax=Neorhizobium huautlense TaxID=67774 RepID=A0ABT9PML9_9HYPH|nr:alpha/beta hydrolase [Neorhizobium huautlense]MDP9835398.1 pimeloyl-ACP methyl ester carboxylesterase [Neorhizobium huautlense]